MTERTLLEQARLKEVEAAVLMDRAILHLPEGIGSSATRELVRLIVDATILRVRAGLIAADQQGVSHE